MANADSCIAVPGRAAGAELRIEVVFGPAAGLVDQAIVQVREGSTVMQALQASGLLERHPQLATAELALGVWGRKASPDQLLRDRDRIEVYRPLTVDPKEARRLRYKGQARAPKAVIRARRRP